jgi:DNA-binding transcriptional regulator YiaG
VTTQVQEPPSGPERAALIARARRLVKSGQARAIRKAARLSQRELAEGAGVTRVAVSKWEAGERLPRGESAVKLVLLLDELAR